MSTTAIERIVLTLPKMSSDACRNVVTDRSEIREILENWELAQHPQEAAKRKKQEAEFAKLEADKKQKATSSSAVTKTKSGKGKKKKKKTKSKS